MARQELPKEDLVRDATAFAIRVELRKAQDDPSWIFVGLRSDGGGAIYFGDDEFYAFNAARQLRRAFANATLFKAEQGRLVAMRRERTEATTVLQSESLPKETTSVVLGDLKSRIETVAAAIDSGSLLVARCAGDATTSLEQVRSWLEMIARGEIVVAERPNAGG